MALRRPRGAVGPHESKRWRRNGSGRVPSDGKEGAGEVDIRPLSYYEISGDGGLEGHNVEQDVEQEEEEEVWAAAPGRRRRSRGTGRELWCVADPEFTQDTRTWVNPWHAKKHVPYLMTW